MVAVAAFACLFDRAGISLLFLVAAVIALREFLALTGSRSKYSRLLNGLCFSALAVQFLFAYVGWMRALWIFVPVYAAIVVPAAAVAAGGRRSSIVMAQWGLVASACLSFVPALLALEIKAYRGPNLLLVVFLVGIVQFSDVLQYVWGMLCGSHLVAPAISPSKTWEGLVGGVASATVLGAALYQYTPFTRSQAATMALVVSVAGVAGGLAFSAVKRAHGVKDWGQLIDGHGGVLDRLDSLVLAAPIFFFLTRWGWT
jgi:phosphatidate cytidylyltransferase